MGSTPRNKQFSSLLCSFPFSLPFKSLNTHHLNGIKNPIPFFRNGV
jgi:hypothetical protein